MAAMIANPCRINKPISHAIMIANTFLIKKSSMRLAQPGNVEVEEQVGDDTALSLGPEYPQQFN